MDRAAIAKRLRDNLSSLEERRAKLARHVEHRDEPLPADFSEQAVELENHETMTALVRRLADEEADTRHALERLERGTYGRCQKCEGSIDEQRLSALPATATCIRCAS